MIRFDEKALLKFESDFAAAWLLFEKELSLRFTNFSQMVFTSLVTGSPQWSGNLTSNWNYSVGSPDESYFEIANKKGSRDSDRIFIRGDDPAKGRAIARMRQVKSPSFRDTVYFTNATPDDEGAYLAETLETGAVKIRAANLISRQVALFNYTYRIFQDTSL